MVFASFSPNPKGKIVSRQQSSLKVAEFELSRVTRFSNCAFDKKARKIKEETTRGYYMQQAFGSLSEPKRFGINSRFSAHASHALIYSSKRKTSFVCLSFGCGHSCCRMHSALTVAASATASSIQQATLCLGSKNKCQSQKKSFALLRMQTFKLSAAPVDLTGAAPFQGNLLSAGSLINNWQII